MQREVGDVEIGNALQVTQSGAAETWLMGIPPVNAINPELLGAFEEELDRVEADDNVCGVVLGSTLKVFSAGADASWMASMVEEVGPEGLLEQFNETMDRFRDVCLRMRRSNVLFVAAIEGHALAGGLELAAACDLRLVADSEELKIGVPEMDLFGALPSGGGGVQYLSRLMGPSSALAFVLDAAPCSPQEALGYGLVDRLHEPDEVQKAAESFVGAATKKAGPVGVAAAKRAILDCAYLGIDEAVRADGEIHWDAMRRGNFLAGVAAFTEQYGSKR